MSYGIELILDLHECDPATFNRAIIERYFVLLCEKIDMTREDLHWWDDVGVPLEEQQTEPHLKGTSAVQFIKTSNVTLHALDLLGNVYINLFSCKKFDAERVKEFSANWFRGKIVNAILIERR